MPERIKQIAARIRELREIAGVSVETLSKEFGIATEEYQNYETGDVDIPVSILYKVANRFGVELTEILTGESPRLHIYSLVRKGKGVGVERRQQYKYQNLAHNFIHKKAEPFLVTVEPNEDQPSFNSHPGQEFNYVLEGTLRLIIDGHEVILQEGDSLFFDSGYQHAMQAMNGKPAKFLAVIF